MIDLARSVWADGIDFGLPGNGGPDCLRDGGTGNRMLETLFSCAIFALATYLGAANRSESPSPSSSVRWPSGNGLVRYALFYAMLITWVAEVGYKLVTSQLIFVFQPCHMICLIQLYLLSDSQVLSPLVEKNTVFRVHLYFMHGPLMACVFPVTNTLFLPGEVMTYWVEHGLLLSIPFYLLLSRGSPYNVASNTELASWTSLSYGAWGFYHYLFLQPLALISLGNLNSILCPAITDPFRGPSYRVHALWHQALATFVSGSFLCQFGRKDIAAVPTKQSS